MGYMVTGEGGFEPRINPLVTSSSETAAASEVITGSVPAAAGDSCTGTLGFAWHCENLDVTLGTPAGCSAGDTVGAATGSPTIGAGITPQDGTNSLQLNAYDEYVSFDVSNDNLADLNVGSVDLYVQWTTWGAGHYIFKIFGSGVKVCLTTDGASELSLRHVTGTTDEELITTGLSLTTGTWYHVVAKWSVSAVSGNNLSIAVTGKTTESKSGSLADGALTGLRFGDDEYNGYGTMYLDNIKIYKEWRS